MNERKRKQKQYYVNQAKRAKFEKRKLRPGLRGFLCTTNNKERECVREAYNLLNEYANQLHGEEHSAQAPAAGGAAQDVEESLETELAALKEEKVSKERRFQQVESGAKNCIFISTQLEQTAPLVERIAQEIRESGTQRTRYLLRLVPVQVTCKATEDDIRASAESMIKEAFTELGVSYTTVYRSRNQAQLTQTDAQTAINSLIDAVCPTARLDHKTPKLTVLMEVIRNVICLGVVRDYFQMKKYNLVELAKGSAGTAEAGSGTAGEGGDGENGGKEEVGSKDGSGNGEAACEGAEEGVVVKAGETGCDAGAKDSTQDSAVAESGTKAAAGEGESSATATAAADEPAAPEGEQPATEDPEKTPAADQAGAAVSPDVGATPATSAEECGGAAEKPVSDAP